MRKVLSILTVVFLLWGLLSESAVAKNDNGKEALTALGDSITYGYNIEKHNHHVSKQAFPELIGNEIDLRVRNLGVPGWTSTQLLEAMQNDQKYRQAVRNADYVTVNIGSNDLLAFFWANEEALREGRIEEVLPTLQQVMLNMSINIQSILSEIHTMNQDAKIVLYNIYNPFPQVPMTDFLLSALINPIFSSFATENENIELADAFSAFHSYHDYEALLLPNDVHPTAKGQSLLAEAGLNALNRLEHN